MELDRIALLAHGGFPDRAKTAVGVLRYADADVVAVLDRDRAGDRVADHLPDVQDAPVVAGVAAAPPFDALVVGVAPIGGGFEPSWRPDVRAALERGADVVAGLHYLLGEDDEFASLAAEHGAAIHDVREPPEDLSVADGVARELDATVVLTVGTDCSTGKMTTTMELARSARERGVDAAVVPTGQTGIIVEGWGIAVDRTVADYAAGAVERMVRSVADHDYVFVEGQGALGHPAYSGVTCAILHGAMPDALVVTHEAGRDAINGYGSVPIEPVDRVAARYESVAEPVAPTEVVAGALDTRGLDGPAAADAVADYADALGVPAADPVRDGADAILGAVVEA